MIIPRRSLPLAALLLLTAFVSAAGLAASAEDVRTTTRVDVSHRQAVLGQPITFTATVTTSGGVVPTGTVTFVDNGVALGTVTLGQGGVATLVTTALPLGNHKLVAVFSPQGPFEPSDDHVVMHVRLIPTTIVLSATPSPSTFGQPVTFTATVSASSGVPTGTVTFVVDGTTAGTVTVDAEGRATLTLSGVLQAGDHVITAFFTATNPFKSSESVALTHSVRSGRIIVVGTDGALGHVKVFDAATQQVVFSFLPYGGFQGRVRVAAGDVNNDGAEDVITVATGPVPHIRVFDGRTLAPLQSFFPFSGDVGEVAVAAGDVDGDGFDDIVAGAATNGHIKVFDGQTGAELRNFIAYPGFAGGVNVAAGDVSGDGFADIITGTGAGGTHVKVFDGQTLAELRSFFAYPGFTGGVYVAAGDVNGDGFVDVITGAGSGATHVKVFDGISNTERSSFLAYGASFVGGVRVGAVDANNDGLTDIVTAPAAAVPHVKVFNGGTLAELASFLAFETAIAVFVNP